MAEPDLDFPRIVFVPWVDEEPHEARASTARKIAASVASKERMPLVGVGATMNQLPDDWGSLPHRTLKSRSRAPHGSVVEVHFWPSLDTLAAMPPHGSHAIVLEWFSDDLSGWARHNHAVHFDTKQTLEPSLSPDAGLDAFAYGAMGAAIGAIPSLRKATPPGEDNHAWNPKDKRPHMAHPTLLRYVRTSELEGWYVNHPYNCGCFECYGRPIYRLGASETDRAEGERHNAIDISRKFDNLRKSGDKAAAWRRNREDAVAAHRQLSIETSREHSVEAGLRHWEQLDAEEAAQPSEQPVP